MKELSNKKLLPLEIWATILYAASVFLFGFNPETAAPLVFTIAWTLSIIACILYIVFFYFKRLYSYMLEMSLYTPLNIIGLLGILFYSITFTGVETAALTTFIYAIIGSIFLGLMLRGFGIGLNLRWPDFFPDAKSPWLDSATTGASLVATTLLIMWNPLTWVFWFFINIAAVILFFKNKAYVVMASYIFFLLNSVRGMIEWGTLEYLANIFIR